MTDTLDQDHAQVFLTALAANPNLGTARVFDGTVPSPTPEPPYVLVYTYLSWPPEADGTPLTTRQVTAVATAVCHCVALTPATARAVGMQVRSSLLNLPAAVTGRACGFVREDEALAPAPDNSTNRLLMDAVQTYSFTSVG